MKQKMKTSFTEEIWTKQYIDNSVIITILFFGLNDESNEALITDKCVSSHETE